MGPPQPGQQAGRGFKREWTVGAVLFDLDGTLIDSLAAVEDAWRAWADVEGVQLPPATGFHGRRAHDLVSSLMPADQVAAAEARLTDIEKHPRVPVVALPGALDLISALPPDRWAVVTSAARPVAIARLASAGLPSPPMLISGDDVRRGKPAPDPFMAGLRWAATELPVVAFEDTRVGLCSAREAGCRAVGVSGSADPNVLRVDADAVVGSLSGVAVLGCDGPRIGLSLDTLA